MMKMKTIFNKFKVTNNFQCSVLIKELESFTKCSWHIPTPFGGVVSGWKVKEKSAQACSRPCVKGRRVHKEVWFFFGQFFILLCDFLPTFGLFGENCLLRLLLVWGWSKLWANKNFSPNFPFKNLINPEAANWLRWTEFCKVANSECRICMLATSLWCIFVKTAFPGFRSASFAAPRRCICIILNESWARVFKKRETKIGLLIHSGD